MKYPIGLQSFEKIRQGEFVYVDKTAQIYRLVNKYQYVFLGRPRRFGKSLLLSTIDAYFQGKRYLFEGLAIDKLTDEWQEHPVLHFDLNNGNFSNAEGLMNLLNDQLMDYERIYGRNPVSDEPQFRLRWIIRQAYEKTGKQVVILVDEYEKPILQAIGNQELDRQFRDILKPFYGTLKSEDRCIRFAMLTGVTKFGKLSVFSDLNNIKDISLSDDYADICGITHKELSCNFSEPIAEFAEKWGVTDCEMTDVLEKRYDGYRFSASAVKVFNPYSLLNAFADKKIRDYWFFTGTPTFLVKLLRQKDYDLSGLEEVKVQEASLYQVENISAIPILYQSGYLTIKAYDPHNDVYMLGYPNQEVASGLLNFLLPYYSNLKADSSRIEILDLVSDITDANIKSFMGRLTSIFYAIPYSRDLDKKIQEDQFRNLIYLVFRLMGMQIQVECPMSRGRSDAVVLTESCVFVFEFKVNRSAEAAIEQIRERRYAEPFRTDGRRVVLIGINYSTVDRGITEWKAEIL